MSSQYTLELVVTDEGAPFYPPLGTIEKRNNDNAGYDLKVVTIVGPCLQATLSPLGVKARLINSSSGEDVHFSLEPRSSIYKSGYIMANSRGVIDRTYRGQLMAPLISTGSSGWSPPIEAGTRLFQIIAPDMGWISEIRYVRELPETSRGEGGFGSTGTV